MVKTPCQVCKNLFDCYPSDLKLGRAKYCGMVCYAQWKSIHNHGENHPSFIKGQLTYKGLHNWINQIHGRASKCENPYCEGIGKRERFDWALLHGFKYERKRENFWQLCRSCHKKYDFQLKKHPLAFTII